MAGDEALCEKALLSGYTVRGSFQRMRLARSHMSLEFPKELYWMRLRLFSVLESLFVPNYYLFYWPYQLTLVGL